MGASVFVSSAKGATAQEAFTVAVGEARHEYGHGGYTGTIAEKSSFVMIDPAVDDEQDTTDWSTNDYENFAYDLCEDDDSRVEDKWGPAGCIKLSDEDWLFFGWASN